MKLTQIRNATLLLEYAGKKFLIDPMLAEKEAWPGFAGNARPHLRNPMVDLPVPLDELLAVDAVIITHTHADHWDEAAQQQVPKNMMIYSQNESDAALLRSQGFENVRMLQDENRFIDGLILYKTDGQHGSNALYADKAMGEILGDACGLVFTHPAEKNAVCCWRYGVGQTLCQKSATFPAAGCGVKYWQCYQRSLWSDYYGQRGYAAYPATHPPWRDNCCFSYGKPSTTAR